MPKFRKKSEVEADKRIKALHAGKRVSENGNTYYESRPNRSDSDRRIKFNCGGVIKTILGKKK